MDKRDLEDLMFAAGIDGDVYEGYSGRYMFGEQVNAITCDYDCRMDLAKAAQDQDIDIDLLPNRIDNMGKGFVIY